MSLEIQTRRSQELAAVIRINDVESKMRGIDILSDKNISENGKEILVLNVVRAIADEAIAGKWLKSEREQKSAIRKAWRALKELIFIDEQARKKIQESLPTRNVRDRLRVVVAPNVTKVYAHLSETENDVDMTRFDMLKELITAEVGEEFLFMIDADWVDSSKAKSYVDACLGEVILTHGSEDAMMKLDDLLGILSSRGNVVLDPEDEEDFCGKVYRSLTLKSRLKIKNMAEANYEGAIEFLMAAEEYGVLRKENDPGIRYQDGVEVDEEYEYEE